MYIYYSLCVWYDTVFLLSFFSNLKFLIEFYFVCPIHLPLLIKKLYRVCPKKVPHEENIIFFKYLPQMLFQKYTLFG